MRSSSNNSPLHEKWLSITESNVAYILLNITRNCCGESYFEHTPTHAIDNSGTADAFLAGVAANIASDELREEFIRRFSTGTYAAELCEGITTKEMRLPMLQQERGVHWHQLTTEAAIDPDTGELQVFAAFADIDKEVRLEYVVSRILENEYEFLCQIDLRTGRIIPVGKNSEAQMPDDGVVISYPDTFRVALKRLIPAEYYEEGIDALSLERIVEELKTKQTYSCMFPVKTDDGMGERICRWSSEYADDIRSTILLRRRNISAFLDYGFDSLTGVMNRNGFCRTVRNELRANGNRRYYLIEMDFDGFKLINEEQGYDEGNRFLRSFGANIRQIARSIGRGSCVGHFEADHFVFLLPADVGMSPEELYERLAILIRKNPVAYRVKLRMGVYRVDNPALDVAFMCDCVSIAHKDAKGRFAEYIRYYTADLRDKMLDEQILVSEMQHALETEQFEIWFQPQVNHDANGSLIGAEALVRWKHPERGMISPAVFIPIFEQNGFIYELDKYVWDHTCRYIRSLMDQGIRPMPISVNVSRLDILQSDFMDTIVSIVEKNNVPFELLHLEITESAFTEAADTVVDTVRRLVERSFTVAIDDFGSGYSSLSMIKSVPAQILKLDMRFFQTHDEARRNECIIESIIRMSKMLGMAVLAEGVEHVEQADFLRSVGCNYIQGFLYSKPLPYSEFIGYTQEKNGELISNVADRHGDGSRRANANELFHSIISGSGDIIVVSDIKTRQLLYANRAAERYYGKGFDPMQNITCSEYCGRTEHCNNCPAMSLMLGERKEDVFRENGRQFKAGYMRMNWNGHEAFVYSLTDITSEMRELELAESLVRNIPVALLVFSQEASGPVEITYVSERAKSIFSVAGVEKEKLTLEDAFGIVCPEDLPRAQKAVAESLREKCELHDEYRIRMANGDVMWIEMAVTPVADQNGGHKYYGIYTDITDRKNGQARADMLIQKLPLALTIFSAAKEGSKRIFLSDAAKKMLGLWSDEEHGIEMDAAYGHIHPDDEERMRQLGRYCVENKTPVSAQLRVRGEDGQYRWVQLDSTPILRENGDYLYYGVYTDISAQKAMECSAAQKD